MLQVSLSILFFLVNVGRGYLSLFLKISGKKKVFQVV